MSHKIGLATLLLLVAFATPARAELVDRNGNSFGPYDTPKVWDAVQHSPGAFKNATPEELEAAVRTFLMGPREGSPFGTEMKPGELAVKGKAVLCALAQVDDLTRWKTLRLLDRRDDANVVEIFGALQGAAVDGKGWSLEQLQLLELVRSAGAAGTAAGLQQLGVISDNDDTAFPTQFHPNGFLAYKGAADFYKLLVGGTDGTGDRANLHYVSARPPFMGLNSLIRHRASGLGAGTTQGNEKIGYALRGLDGIQASKEENIRLWLMLHPGQRFVCLGDTIQRDPEVYRTFLRDPAFQDQIELVLIHKAGGLTRNPADYAGEIFFGDYDEARKIVLGQGTPAIAQVPQPGARLPAKIDLSKLPLPDTDVSKIHEDTGAKEVLDFVGETGLSFGKVAVADPVVELGRLFGHLFRRGKPTKGVAGALPGP
jgi:hypothetical protein